MKKIIDKFEIIDLYIKEFPHKIKQLAESKHGELKIMMTPNSFHFRKFKLKHFFLNQWKWFLNWCEVKFFPELAAPRFEKKILGGVVKQEFSTEIRKRYSYTYKQAVVVEKGFYKGLTGVVLKQSEMMGIPVDIYEVEIIEKTGTDIVEISGSDMRPAKKS